MASKRPWGNGKCEKVVGLLKEMMKLKENGVKRKKKFGLSAISARNSL